MPSMAAWWALVSTAKRPPATPSISHTSHSGRLLSSWVDISSPASFRQLGGAAGCRHCDVADVPTEVELRIVDPPRMVQLQRHLRQPSAGTAGRGGSGPRRPCVRSSTLQPPLGGRRIEDPQDCRRACVLWATPGTGSWRRTQTDASHRTDDRGAPIRSRGTVLALGTPALVLALWSYCRSPSA